MGRLRKTKRLSKRMSKNRKNQSKKRFSKSIKRKRGGSAHLEAECLIEKKCKLIIYGEMNPAEKDFNNFFNKFFHVKEKSKVKYLALALGKKNSSTGEIIEYTEFTKLLKKEPKTIYGEYILLKKRESYWDWTETVAPDTREHSIRGKKESNKTLECSGIEDGQVFTNGTPYGQLKYLKITPKSSQDKKKNQIHIGKNYNFELLEYKDHPYDKTNWPRHGDIFFRFEDTDQNGEVIPAGYFMVVRVDTKTPRSITLIGITKLIEQLVNQGSASAPALQYSAPYQASPYQAFPNQPQLSQPPASPYPPPPAQPPAKLPALVPTSVDALSKLQSMLVQKRT